METLMIINSILVAVSTYFLKNFHADFKEIEKKVSKLEERFRILSTQLMSHLRQKSKTEEN